MVNVHNIICAYETEVILWIKEHFKELGYEQIIQENDRKGPDLILLRNGKEVSVEVEIYASSFLKHQHDPKEVDGVLCVVDDVKLPVKTFKIKQLRLWYHLNTDELIDFFKQRPDTILINHKTSQTLYHFQKEWLNLSKEREKQIRESLRKEANFE